MGKVPNSPFLSQNLLSKGHYSTSPLIWVELCSSFYDLTKQGFGKNKSLGKTFMIRVSLSLYYIGLYEGLSFSGLLIGHMLDLKMLTGQKKSSILNYTKNDWKYAI